MEPKATTSESDFLQSGLNLIDQAISIFDRDLRLAAWNTRFVTLFNLPQRLAVRGQSFEAIIRFLIEAGEYGQIDNIDQYVAERLDQARAFEPHYFERQRDNGAIISVEGHPLTKGGWVTVYTDISQTKAKERLLESRTQDLHGQVSIYAADLSSTNRELKASIAALEETKRQLMASEERMRMAFDYAPAHIAQISPERRYIYSNGGLSRLLPDMPGDIVGRSVAEVLGQSSFDRVAPAIDRAFDGQTQIVEFTHEADGKRLRVAFTPVQEAGRTTAVNALTLDITEETISRAMIAQANRRATAAMMVSGLAHDFSNLLLIIQAAQNELLKAHDLDAVEVTLRAAERGRELIARISKMTAGGSGKPERTDLVAVLKELDYLVRPLLSADLRLVIQTHEEAVYVLLDRGYLVDCLINLVINAQHAIEGRNRNEVAGAALATGEIVFDLRMEGQRAHLQVRDTGEGFSPEALAHGFEPFFTTRSETGSGLGLSSVFDLSHQAGGSARLSNQPSGGAQVDIFLPAERGAGSGAGAQGGPVLLVENDSLLRAEERQVIRQLGYQVLEASNGHEALALLASQNFGFIVSDLDLGQGPDGLAVAQQGEEQGIPGIIISALPASSPQRQAAEGRYAFISKPLNAAGLAATVEALNRREQPQEAEA